MYLLPASVHCVLYIKLNPSRAIGAICQCEWSETWNDSTVLFQDECDCQLGLVASPAPIHFGDLSDLFWINFILRQHDSAFHKLYSPSLWFLNREQPDGYFHKLEDISDGLKCKISTNSLRLGHLLRDWVLLRAERQNKRQINHSVSMTWSQ